MKLKVFILDFILCFSFIAKAQNLVPNGYFELNDTCPNGTSLYPNDMQINYAVPWRASALTPDYYHICSNEVPLNIYGYQKDCCGNGAYTGIYVLDKTSTTNDDREYISTKLLDTLKVGHKYLASMYVSKSDEFDYAIASLGMLFTDTLTNLPWPQGSILASPQVKNTSLIYDTLNWVLVQDSFIVTSNKIYLTIGNFSSNATSDSVKVGGNGAFYGQAYYYIDGVSVYEINGTCNNDWDAGYDKYIIEGDSIRLGAINTDNSTYNWQNSLSGTTYLSSNTDSRPWSKPTQTTTYYVTKTCPNNNIFIDTVTVNVQSTVGIKQLVDNSEQLMVYPNPSSVKITIEYNILSDAQLRITDLTGKLISTYTIKVSEKSIQLNNETLVNGMYLYTIINEQGLVKTGRIIILK